jgi:hypothetical protein
VNWKRNSNFSPETFSFPSFLPPPPLPIHLLYQSSPNSLLWLCTKRSRETFLKNKACNSSHAIRCWWVGWMGSQSQVFCDYKAFHSAHHICFISMYTSTLALLTYTGRNRLSAVSWLGVDNRFGRLNMLGGAARCIPCTPSLIGLPKLPLVPRVA